MIGIKQKMTVVENPSFYTGILTLTAVDEFTMENENMGDLC